MQQILNEMIIFLRDDGISLQYPDGQCAGYGPDGTMQIFVGDGDIQLPKKIILHDQRTLHVNPKTSGNES
jgi:hypothetical protein